MMAMVMVLDMSVCTPGMWLLANTLNEDPTLMERLLLKCLGLLCHYLMTEILDILAVGAPWNGSNGFKSGHVQVYTWNEAEGKYTQRGLDIDGDAAWDQSGQSVSLSADGNTLAVGAYPMLNYRFYLFKFYSS